MSLDNLEALKLEFIQQPNLDRCVAAGKMYQVDDDIFILFVLAEDDGCTVCYGRGNANNTPVGDSFTRLSWFDSLDKALDAFEKFDSVAADFFSSLPSDPEI